MKATSEKTMRWFFYKNLFYNNLSLVPSLLSKNKNLVLTLENWKKKKKKKK